MSTPSWLIYDSARAAAADGHGHIFGIFAQRHTMPFRWQARAHTTHATMLSNASSCPEMPPRRDFGDGNARTISHDAYVPAQCRASGAHVSSRADGRETLAGRRRQRVAASLSEEDDDDDGQDDDIRLQRAIA